MKNISARRLIGTLLGIFIMSIGAAFFKASMQGNDATTCLVMRICDLIGQPLGITNIIFNGCCLILQLIWGRKYIGPGTIINMCTIGFLITFNLGNILRIFAAPETFPVKLVWMFIGMLFLSFGCALYQTADLGVCPYDSLALMLTDYSHKPYFGCRMLTDGTCALACFLLGGFLGLGTLVCAFCLGPFVQFFTRNICVKALKYDPSAK